jgi:hypothetical protein
MMFGCLVALIARLALLVTWLTTPRVANAFHDGWILPLLGLLFLPLTTLTYVIVYALENGVNGWGWAWVVFALCIDLTSHGAGASANRHRIASMRKPEG